MVFRLFIGYSTDQHNMVGVVGGVKVVEATMGLFEHALVPVFFVYTEDVWMFSILAIISNMILSDHVDKQENVSNAARMKPHWTVVARDISHPVGGCGASLGSKLYVALDLADVLDDFRVRHDVAHQLVVEEVPGIWNATV